MTNLSKVSVKELKEMARENNIPNWWELKKAELIEALGDEEPKEIVEPQVVVEPEMTFEVDLSGVPQEVTEDVEPEANVNTLSEEKDDSEAKSEAQKKNQKRLIEYNGKVQSLTAWAKELGIRHQTLYNRIVMKGCDIDRAFETPKKKEVTVDVERIEIE